MKTYLSILLSICIIASMATYAWADPINLGTWECWKVLNEGSTPEYNWTSSKYECEDVFLTVSDCDHTITFNPDTENECTLDEVVGVLRRCREFIESEPECFITFAGDSIEDHIRWPEWKLGNDIETLIKKLEALTQ